MQHVGSRMKFIAPIAITLMTGSIAACSGGNGPSQTGAAPPMAVSSNATATATHRGGHDATTKDIYPGDYMAVDFGEPRVGHGVGTPPPSQMMCHQENPVANCITSYFDTVGSNLTTEVQVESGMGNNQGFVAVTSAAHPTSPGSSAYIGVIRSNDPGNGIRCYSTSGQQCGTQPANSYDMPQAVPYHISALPVVSAAVEAATLNTPSPGNPPGEAGTPNHTIPGAMLTTPGGSPAGFWSFGWWDMDPNTCAQSFHATVTNSVHIVYVTQIDFGGNIGTNDAVVVDEEETGPPPHIERYYYVLTIGQVRQTTAYGKDPGGPYGLGPFTTINKPYLENLDTTQLPYDFTPPCAQGGTKTPNP